MTDKVIILLGVAAAIVLLSGVAVTAYSRIKSFGRHGAKLDELLSSIEDELEATHVADTLAGKPKAKAKTAPKASDPGEAGASKQDTAQDKDIL